MTPPAAGRAAVLASGLCALLAAAGVAAAQEQPGGNPFISSLASAVAIEFNFSNPGARSLGMGGAFIGRADDATAAYANPAGLVQLREPELSLELRSLDVPIVLGFADRELEDTSRVPSYASYVYPRGRWTLALYRHVQADYDVEVEPRTSTRIEIVGTALAAAYRVGKGLSLGAAVVVYDGLLEAAAPCESLADACGDPGQLTLERAEDTRVGGNVGLLWQISTRWSAGAVYRRQSRLDVTSTRTAADGVTVLEALEPYTLRVPDIFGLGASWRASNRLVLAFDYARVRYSQSLDEIAETRFFAPDEPSRVLGEFSIRDADELHLGLEYSFWNVKRAPALRLGAWYDPGHRLEFAAARDLDCGAPSGAGEAAACILAARFNPGGDRFHLSAGLGLVLGRRFQLDAAADVADQIETFSVSILARF